MDAFTQHGQNDFHMAIVTCAAVGIMSIVILRSGMTLLFLWLRKVQSEAPPAVAAFRGIVRKGHPSLETVKKLGILQEFICPITFELPANPVTATDGRIYERSAIEEYIDSCKEQGLDIRSPITNNPMEERLLPAPQVKNLIGRFVEEDMVPEDLRGQWDTQAETLRAISLKRAAEGGDGEAMFWFGVEMVRTGKVFSQDGVLAYEWFQKAHNVGFNEAAAAIGLCHAHGIGVKKNESDGIWYIGEAAGKDSCWAASLLGRGFATGEYGLTANKSKAIQWLESAVLLSGAGSQITTPEWDAENRQRLRDLKNPGCA